MKLSQILAPIRQSTVTRFRRWGAAIARHEHLLAAVGALTAAISAVAAAAALYLTTQQLAIMRREQITPYKVAIYGERLAAIKLTLNSMARFESSALCYKSLRAQRSSGLVVNRNNYSKCYNEVLPNLNELVTVMHQEILFWPKSLRKLLLDYTIAAETLNMCEFERDIINARNIPEYIKYKFYDECSGNTEEEFKKLENFNLVITRNSDALLNEDPSK